MFAKSVCALGAVLMLAGGGVGAATVDEVAARALDLKKAETEAKLQDVQRKGAPAAPMPLPQLGGGAVAIDDDNIRLAGVYGLNGDLRADVVYRGAVVPLSKENPKLGPWKLVEISSTSIKLARGKETRLIVLSAPPESGAGTSQGVAHSLPQLPAAGFR